MPYGMIGKEIYILRAMSNNKYVKVAVYLFLYLISVVVAVMLRTNYYNHALGNSLYLEIDKMTGGFQLKQIVASVILFMAGYCIGAVMLPFLSEFSKLILSMPLGIAVWGLSSVSLLILRIPYTRITSFAGAALWIAVLLFRYRSGFSFVRGRYVLGALAIASILANFFSTGYPRYTMTSDTHYCVYMYGRLIASTGKLSANVVGDMMETTGIMPALMSCFAVFCGFETIQVMHFILMTSLIAGIAVCLYKVFLDMSLPKYKSIGLMILLMLTAAAPLFLMYDLMISHSWIMVSMFFLATMAEQYSKMEDKVVRGGVISLLSILCSWISLCRVEAIVTVVFMVVCISYLGFSRREIAKCVLPSMVIAGVFHLENQIMIMGSKDLPYGSVFITKSVLALMAAAIVLMAGYILLYEKAWVRRLQQSLPLLLLGLLFLVSAAFCFKDIEKANINFQSICYNLSSLNERWYYFPFFALILFVLIMKNKREYGYWDMLVWGLVLVFFCMAMGRSHPLRNGWGDSFNRYLLHIVPLMLVYFARSLCFCRGKTDKKEYPEQ